MTDTKAKNRARLQSLLREDLFRIDTADLDFGIYRIMNEKRAEVERFIEEDLLDAVEQGLAQFHQAERKKLEAVLLEKKAKLIPKAFDADGSVLPPYDELPDAIEYMEAYNALKQLELADETEARIFDDLYTFFSRYYDNGDFLTEQRYTSKDAKYAVPYNGEEVLLHWANRDQYYIKTTQHFTDYLFDADDYHIWFRLERADVPQDNVKGDKRYFVLRSEDPLSYNAEKKTLTLHFEYRPITAEEDATFLGIYNAGKNKSSRRKKLNQHIVCEALEFEILKGLDDPNLKARLAVVPEGKKRSVLFAHLNRYTAHNTMDYFVHKKLADFLGRELDFFIKSHILRLDDLVAGEKDLADHIVARARVVRIIALAIIAFLAQTEDFQKRLFEKKKFVVQTDYCITLDRVPTKLYPEIVANKGQVDEWRKLRELEDLSEPGLFTSNDAPYVSFLKTHQNLVLDTRHFATDFKIRLLSSFPDLDEAVDGILVHGENYQALNLLLAKYAERVKCCYIDPPFNTGTNEFLYKNNYLDSTWLCMLFDRMLLGRRLLHNLGNFFFRIDYHGDFYVRQLCEQVFTRANFRNQIIVKRGRETVGSRDKLETATESVFWFKRSATSDFHAIEIPRPISQVQWTGFTMGGERHPRERTFLGKTMVPSPGQHFSLVQPKVDLLLEEFFLRLRCGQCGTVYFRAESDTALHKQMKKKANRYKFYDITAERIVHGVMELDVCLECDSDQFRVDYLGAPTETASNLWIDIESYASLTGFYTENSEALLKRVIEATSVKGEWVLDFFLGSGTTAAAAHKLRRRWIGVEMGQYFDETTLPRMKEVLSGDTRGISKDIDWEGGGLFKYHRIESYEDALNNIRVRPPKDAQLEFIETTDDFLLHYMLDFETQDSPTFLSAEAFEKPSNYKLKIQRGHETPQDTVVDLVETFHYLIGLHIRKLEQHQHQQRTYVVSRGDVRTEQGIERVITIWRDTEQLDLDAEADWANEVLIIESVDRVYVNGISHIYKAEPLEITFRQRMEGGDGAK